jgi:two-component sensor histidine kinase
MVAVHEEIYGTDSFDRVEVAPYAERLIREIADTYPGRVNVETHLQSLSVDRDHALPIGMIITEVVANAFKYAFDGRDNGKLSVNLSTTDEGQGLLQGTNDCTRSVVSLSGTAAATSSGSRTMYWPFSIS